MTNEGYLQLDRIEQYLDDQMFIAARKMIEPGNDGADYFWYHDGCKLVTDILDEVPLEVAR